MPLLKSAEREGKQFIADFEFESDWAESMMFCNWPRPPEGQLQMRVKTQGKHLNIASDADAQMQPVVSFIRLLFHSPFFST